jgi:phosphoserine phosphatase
MDRMRDYLKTLCAGWPVETVNAIVAETLHELIDPMVYAEAVALFDQHHAAGRDVVIVSSSGEEVVGPIGDMLGVDHVIATRHGGPGRQVHRRDRLLRLRRGQGRGDPRARPVERGYDLEQCWAYSDSFTDRPMLEAVGNPVAGQPRTSPCAGTPRSRVGGCGSFSAPSVSQPPSPGDPSPPGPPAAYAGVAVAAGAVGPCWWAGRKR